MSAGAVAVPALCPGPACCRGLVLPPRCPQGHPLPGSLWLCCAGSRCSCAVLVRPRGCASGVGTGKDEPLELGWAAELLPGPRLTQVGRSVLGSWVCSKPPGPALSCRVTLSHATRARTVPLPSAWVPGSRCLRVAVQSSVLIRSLSVAVTVSVGSITSTPGTWASRLILWPLARGLCG